MSGFSCCARRSSSLSSSLGSLDFQPRCGERFHCLWRHLGRGGTRCHGLPSPLQPGAGGPGRWRGGESWPGPRRATTNSRVPLDPVVGLADLDATCQDQGQDTLYSWTSLPIKPILVGTHLCCLLRNRKRAALFLSCTRRLKVKLVPRWESPWFSI